MKKIIKKFINIILRIKYNINNNCYIEENVKLLHTKLQKNIILSKGCNVVCSDIGCYTYLGEETYLPYCKIGKFCSIAPNVRLAAGLHPMTFISTHPVFYNQYKKAGNIEKTHIEFETLKKLEDSDNLLCEIGNDVWIATNALLVYGKAPLHIGNGAIIAAGAVVTKNVPPYAIVMGVPAKIVGYRFQEDIIKKINASEWWEKDEEWLNKNCHTFNDVNEFLKLFEL